MATRKSEVYVDQKFANRKAAVIVGESDALEVIARRVYNYARKAARPHVVTSEYINTIQMEHMAPNKWGVRDWEIFTDDWASYHIEVGHYAPDKHVRGAVWVEGQWIFKDAIKELPGKWVRTKKV